MLCCKYGLILSLICVESFSIILLFAILKSLAINFTFYYRKILKTPALLWGVSKLCMLSISNKLDIESPQFRSKKAICDLLQIYMAHCTVSAVYTPYIFVEPYFDHQKPINKPWLHRVGNSVPFLIMLYLPLRHHLCPFPIVRGLTIWTNWWC